MGFYIGGEPAEAPLATSMDCAHCGASLPVPADLNVVSVTCQYCNAHQPVPDLAARRRALALAAKIEQERRDEALAAEQGRAFQRDIQSRTKWAMVPGLVIGGCSVVFAIFMMARSAINFPTPFSTPSRGAIPGLPMSWDGTRTLECKSGDIYDLAGVVANVRGTAIRAAGGCVINMRGGSIHAETAVQAWGNAIVNLNGVTIESTIAVEASGTATVVLQGGKVVGKIKKSGKSNVTTL